MKILGLILIIPILTRAMVGAFSPRYRYGDTINALLFLFLALLGAAIIFGI